MDSNALARLKAVAGRQTLTLTHYGRKSGKPYDVTIRRKYWMYRPLIALGQILTAIGVMRDKSGAFEVVLAR